MKRALTVSLLAVGCFSILIAPVAQARGETPGLMDPATQSPGLSAGEKAPSVSLVDHEGTPVDLGAMYANGPVVVMFYRGGWCPFCTRALKDWESAAARVVEAGGTLVAITPESPEHASNTRQKHAPSLAVLSDPQGEVANAFRVAFEMEPDLQTKYKGFGVDLAERNANGRWELPAPATFVIDRDGVVRWAFADWDYKKRANPDDVVAAVRNAIAR